VFSFVPKLLNKCGWKFKREPADSLPEIFYEYIVCIVVVYRCNFGEGIKSLADVGHCRGGRYTDRGQDN